MKKTLVLLLVLCMLLAALIGCNDTPDTPDDPNTPPNTDQTNTSDTADTDADHDGQTTDYRYTENEVGEITITKYIGTASDVTVPAQINGKNVTVIGEYAFYRWYHDDPKLISVTLPNTVTAINLCAFGKCADLTTVVLPEGLITIGQSAFSECKSLSEITLPDTLKELGTMVFYMCTSLKSINIPDSVTVLPEYIFFGTALEAIILPKNLESIGSHAFSGVNIKELVIPASVKTIGSGAFYYCNELTSVTLNEGLTTIENWAFTDTPQLIALTIPASVTKLTECAFSQYLQSLTFLGTIPEGYLVDPGYISDGFDYTIYCSNEAGVTFPRWNGYKTQCIGSDARGETVYGDFEYMATNDGAIAITAYLGSAEHITVPAEIDGKPVTEIGMSAFRYSEAVTVTLPDTIKIIGDRAFYCCTALIAIELPPNVQIIGNNAFGGCCQLLEITLPPSLASLGSYAFNNCRALKTITIPASLKKLEEYTFFASGLTSVVLEEGLEYIGEGVFESTFLTEIILPSSIKSIGKNAFYQCYLTTVTLNEGLVSIGDYAFRSNALTEIIIPASVIHINETAFVNNRSLKQVKFEGNAPENYLCQNDYTQLSYTVYYHSDATGFTSPEWNGYTTEIW